MFVYEIIVGNIPNVFFEIKVEYEQKPKKDNSNFYNSIFKYYISNRNVCTASR